MARLRRLLTSSSTSFVTKYMSLVLSILLYGCETWNIRKDTERRIKAFKHRCLRRMLPHLLHRAQDQRLRPQHDCNIFWST
ncbi:hypothetical protein DPMN_161330 [Dreissena polymorpha]|uniref:Endonuclease-reverse transcriptase n=1 Tax=Dreissena polymorpha TaxID=45954 RepID=A0A9D4ITC1_DREPO|nr:hypothetical protein DPMN_161330 [Dreissena polymorpha]